MDYDECAHCPLCKNVMVNFGIFQCSHTLCGTCSIRLRVICKSKDCPICRSSMPQVCITEKNCSFPDLNLSSMLFDTESDLYFDGVHMKNFYNSLLVCKCSVEHCNREEPNMSALNRHCNTMHQLMYCDLCLANLKHFPSEFQCYTSEELIKHRSGETKTGTSGHPLCSFCHRRYFDLEFLFMHLKKDHFMCHLCEQENIALGNIGRPVFNDFEELRFHFKESHYMCEEGTCNMPDQFPTVFLCEAELKSHRLTSHQLSRAEQREASQLNIPIRFTNPPVRGRGGRGGFRGRGGGYGQESVRVGLEVNTGGAEDGFEEGNTTTSQFYEMNPADFPSLSGQVAQSLAKPPNLPITYPTNNSDGFSMSYYVSDMDNRHLDTVDVSRNPTPATTTDTPTLSTNQNSVAASFSHITVKSSFGNLDNDFPALASDNNVASSGISTIPSAKPSKKSTNSGVWNSGSNQMQQAKPNSVSGNKVKPTMLVSNVNQETGISNHQKPLASILSDHNFPTLVTNNMSNQAAALYKSADHWGPTTVAPSMTLIPAETNPPPQITSYNTNKTANAPPVINKLSLLDDFPSLGGVPTNNPLARPPDWPKINTPLSSSAAKTTKSKQQSKQQPSKPVVLSKPSNNNDNPNQVSQQETSNKKSNKSNKGTESKSFASHQENVPSVKPHHFDDYPSLPSTQVESGISSVPSKFNILTELPNMPGEEDKIPETSRFIPSLSNTKRTQDRNKQLVLDDLQDFPSLGLSKPQLPINSQSLNETSKTNKVNKRKKDKARQVTEQAFLQYHTNGNLGHEDEEAQEIVKKPVFTMADLAASLLPQVQYQVVPDAETRNAALFLKLQDMYEDQFSEFMRLSGLYKDHQLSAKEYLTSIHTLLVTVYSNNAAATSKLEAAAVCNKKQGVTEQKKMCNVETLADSVLADVMQEMIALLPDIALQKNLLQTVKPAWKSNLRSCYHCGQVFVIGDLCEHQPLCGAVTTN